MDVTYAKQRMEGNLVALKNVVVIEVDQDVFVLKQ